jgi:hypothetical protein
MNDAHKLANDLRNFTGCEQPYFQKLFPAVVYTDGFKHFIDNAGGGAHWLFHILGSEPAILRGVRTEGFGVALLHVNEDGSADLTLDDGNDVVFFRRRIEHTDCPRLTDDRGATVPWKFYMEPAEVGDKPKIIIMLPGER